MEFKHQCNGQRRNKLELLAIKLAIFSFTKGKRVKTIHFQIENKAGLSYFLKMGGTKNEHMIKLSKDFHPKDFQAVSRLLGSRTINLFASHLCHHLPQYIAWHPDPYSQGTDAMIQN